VRTCVRAFDRWGREGKSTTSSVALEREKGMVDFVLPSSEKYAAWLAVFRIYAGIFWLTHGIPKLLSPNFAGGMAGMISQMSSGTSGPYHDFLQNVVLNNTSLFSHLVAWGETLTGVSLLLGVLTPAGGIVGMFLALNYFLMKGSYSQIMGLGGLDFSALMLSFINVVLPTGLKWGIDGMFNRSRVARPAAGET
jgi:uncharacterized membrane protein YphA (DoxX/SURF4 family)